MIPRLSTTDRLIGWLACKAIKLLRVSDAEWHALCEDGKVHPDMQRVVMDYRMVREYERTMGGE